MKKLLFSLLGIFVAMGLSAQTCMRDSSAVTSPTPVAPAPYTDANPVNNLAPVCIGLPYEQSVSLYVIESFQGFPIDSVSIAQTGAIGVVNGPAIGPIPAGLTYKCDPPSCRFKKGTLGCVLLYGTATAANAPGRIELGIQATVHTAIFPLPVTFPGQIAAGSHYYLDFYAPGSCPVATNELEGKIAAVKNAPNPFTYQTEIIIESLVNGSFNFEVFDLLGQRVQSQNIQVYEGRNTFTFDAGDLANGTYFYTVGNRDGKITKRMTIAH